jgi:hypothetical protein
MIPGFWPNETSGVLVPAMLRYLEGQVITGEEVAAIRAYLRQWINAPGWRGPEIDDLRGMIDGLTTREAIDAWLASAEACGIDPL